jgi:hypothetical protein
MPVHRDTSSFDLAVRNPHPVKGNQTKITENNRIPAGRVTGHISTLNLAMSNTFRT